MRLEEKKLVHDALKASESIRAFTTEKSFSDYRSDDMLRAAVERKFEIIWFGLLCRRSFQNC